ncbi:MAG TPA: DMT family transporter [Gammaproteobacteria bacterium]|nr:DMT family transporter [Gammaproteobacteria bacterium]
MPRHTHALKTGVPVLLFVTLVWGTTFPIIRAASSQLSGVEISALRFLIAGLCMLPFAVKANRTAWRDGLLLGAVALVSYVTQAIGLEYISANRSAFITSLNVLMVPLLGVLLGGRLSLQIMLAAILACAGIGLMSWESGGNWLGDGATFLCALSYAIYVILLSRRIRLHATRTLAATQIVAMAVLGLVWLAVAEVRGPALASLLPRAESAWVSLLYLGVVASAGMLFLQAAGQRQVSAEKAAVIYAMEPVFAALFGWLWLGETLGLRGFAGGALVVAAVILGEWRFRPVKRTLGAT